MKKIVNLIKKAIKSYTIPFVPLELLKWKMIDIYRFFKYPRKIHLYGIIGIVGLYGGGKTISLVRILEQYRKRYGSKILIATNFGYKGEDFPIKHWKDLLPEYDKPVVFGYDELQNEFNSREYKDFPVSLMTLLTQNRKGNGKQIIYTTQDYSTVDKNFRRLTATVVQCKTHFGRLTSLKYFHREDYEQLHSTNAVERKMKIRPKKRDLFVQDDVIRDKYDSFQMLESAKNKQYRDQLNTNSIIDNSLVDIKL